MLTAYLGRFWALCAHSASMKSVDLAYNPVSGELTISLVYSLLHDIRKEGRIVSILCRYNLSFPSVFYQGKGVFLQNIYFAILLIATLITISLHARDGDQVYRLIIVC